MDRDREITRLMNVIRVTAKMAMRLSWMGKGAGAGPDAASFCAGQYNKVIARLHELNPQFAPFFQPLPENSSLSVTGMACRLLSSYYHDSTRISAWMDRRAERARRAQARAAYRFGRRFARL